MTHDANRIIVPTLAFLFLISLPIVTVVEAGQQRAQPGPEPAASGDSASCLPCHREKSPAIVE